MSEQTTTLGVSRAMLLATWALVAVAAVVKFNTTEAALRNAGTVGLVSSEMCPREPDKAVVQGSRPDESQQIPAASGALTPAIYIEVTLPSADKSERRFII